MDLSNARLRVQMHNSNAHESGTKKRRRNFMKKALSPATSSGGGSKLHNLFVYLRQHWQLYVIFMLPAFLLTVSCPEISLRRTF